LWDLVLDAAGQIFIPVLSCRHHPPDPGSGDRLKRKLGGFSKGKLATLQTRVPEDSSAGAWLNLLAHWDLFCCGRYPDRADRPGRERKGKTRRVEGSNLDVTDHPFGLLATFEEHATLMGFRAPATAMFAFYQQGSTMPDRGSFSGSWILR
jgi:hypothetical protein